MAAFKRFQKRHIFPFQGKLWPAITRQHIELESCSNPVMTSGVVQFTTKKSVLNLGGGFSATGIMTRHVFWLILWRHHPIQRANILARNIFGFYARIRVFRALDWVSSVCGSKVMPKIFQIWQETPRGLAGISGISPINILSFLP